MIAQGAPGMQLLLMSPAGTCAEDQWPSVRAANVATFDGAHAQIALARKCD